jgi:hypothetical protein
VKILEEIAFGRSSVHHTVGEHPRRLDADEVVDFFGSSATFPLLDDIHFSDKRGRGVDRFGCRERKSERNADGVLPLGDPARSSYGSRKARGERLVKTFCVTLASSLCASKPRGRGGARPARVGFHTQDPHLAGIGCGSERVFSLIGHAVYEWQSRG